MQPGVERKHAKWDGEVAIRKRSGWGICRPWWNISVIREGEKLGNRQWRAENEMGNFVISTESLFWVMRRWRKMLGWNWRGMLEWRGEGQGARWASSWFLEMPGTAMVARNTVSQGHVVPKRSRAEYFSSWETSVHNSTAATPVHRLCDQCGFCCSILVAT